MRRGHREKSRRREEALERGKKYKAPKNPIGLRERVRRGLILLDEAVELASSYNDDIRSWLSRRKTANVKVAVKNKTEDAKKKRRGKQKRKNVRKNKTTIT